MTPEEIKATKERQKQELEVLRAELSSLKPGRSVYLSSLGSHNTQNHQGNVYFKVSNLPELRSNLEKQIKKLDK